MFYLERLSGETERRFWWLNWIRRQTELSLLIQPEDNQIEIKACCWARLKRVLPVDIVFSGVARGATWAMPPPPPTFGDCFFSN